MEANQNSIELDKLREFKAYVHRRLDEMGISSHPDGEHSKAGCRIGDRLDLVERMVAHIRKLEAMLNDPEQLGEYLAGM